MGNINEIDYFLERVNRMNKREGLIYAIEKSMDIVPEKYFEFWQWLFDGVIEHDDIMHHLEKIVCRVLSKEERDDKTKLFEWVKSQYSKYEKMELHLHNENNTDNYFFKRREFIKLKEKREKEQYEFYMEWFITHKLHNSCETVIGKLILKMPENILAEIVKSIDLISLAKGMLILEKTASQIILSFWLGEKKGYHIVKDILEQIKEFEENNSVSIEQSQKVLDLLYKIYIRIKVKSAILGIAVGDALGVPVEFMKREDLEKDPVINMRGYGTYSQPAGTWSDDTSMTLCTLDSLATDIDYDDMMQCFCRWFMCGEYTPHGEIFDIGITTQEELRKYAYGELLENCGATSEFSNGNGSLMRIMPIALYAYMKNIDDDDQIVEITSKVSALTHAHIISKIACVIYVMIALEMLNGEKGEEAVYKGIERAYAYYTKHNIKEISDFDRIRDKDFKNLPIDEIRSTGYVIDSLEASLYCFLNTNSYESCIFMSVNLGGDTDTIGAISGGLAGLEYDLGIGMKCEVVKALAAREKIDKICTNFFNSLMG